MFCEGSFSLIRREGLIYILSPDRRELRVKLREQGPQSRTLKFRIIGEPDEVQQCHLKQSAVIFTALFAFKNIPTFSRMLECFYSFSGWNFLWDFLA
jgi:hypothetical protein